MRQQVLQLTTSFPSAARHQLSTCAQGWKLSLLIFPFVNFGGAWIWKL